MDLADRRALMAVARGERPADLFIAGATLVNVYTGELHPANVAVYRGRIAYVGERQTGLGEGTEVIDARGLYLAPGLVEPHAHPFILFNPTSYAEAALCTGQTAAFADDVPWNLLGAPGLHTAARATEALPFFFRFLARPERATEGLPPVPLADTEERLALPAVAGMMEYGRWPRQYRGEAPYLEAIDAALRLGKRAEGHLAGASAERLSALVAAGLTSDHEPITAREALERLRLGLWVMLRHSSLRPDLPALLPLLTEHRVDTARLMLTTDGATPAWAAEHGLLDEMLRILVRAGVPPVQALQMATRNPATYYGLEGEIGGVAPGRRADLVLYPDLREFRPQRVLAAGKTVVLEGRLTAPLPRPDWPSLAPVPVLPDPGVAANPALYLPPAAAGEAVTLPVMAYENPVIARRRDVTLPVRNGRPDLAGGPPDLLLAALVLAPEPGGKPRRVRVARALVTGLGFGPPGLATTLHVAAGILAVGRDPDQMALAARRVAEMGGGIAVAWDGAVQWEWPLPVAGLGGGEDFPGTAAREQEFRAILRRWGYPHHEPVYTYLFFTGDLLPRMRLTPAGLFDVLAEAVLMPAEG
ncbi:MAG: amidohydrolase family protein [Firmicutes bacterium]|nr:amidohydrolase family protein [Bacillota bacterium]